MYNNRKWLNSEEVAKILHCSSRQVTKYRQLGILHGTRVGKPWLYCMDDVETLLETNKGKDVSVATKYSSESAAELFGISSKIQ